MDAALLPAFETPFFNRFFLQFHYCDAKGAQTKRHVEPQAMLILPPIWYLVAWDPSREDFRHFQMDRIRAPNYLDGSSFRRRAVPFADGVRPIRIV